MPTVRTGLPCPDCGSSDALALYDDDSTYCFSCKHYCGTPGGYIPEALSACISDDLPKAPIPKGIVGNVPSRGLHAVSLDYYGVNVEFSEETGEVSKIWFPVYRKGEQTGWKIKDLEQGTYTATGDCKSPDLFGANKAGEGGKLLIVTEGELDCLSAYQMLAAEGKSYNVVSLPNGANVAAVRKNLEWLESFETIILNLDNDDVGKECAREIAGILTPGKVKIIGLPVKDANEFLMAGKKGYLQAVWNAKVYKPDCIISAGEVWREVAQRKGKESTPYPWLGLERKLYGMRKGEIVTWTAGTGTGKSAVMRELEHWIWSHTDDNIGILGLEEDLDRTMAGIAGIDANLNLAVKEEWPSDLTEEARIAHFAKVFDGDTRIQIINNLQQHTEEKLLSDIRYMIKGLQCEWIILDHISIFVSALDAKVDERRAIDIIMTKLRALCQETGAGMHIVCHLNRREGAKSHEQGLEVGLSHLRGSQAIAQLSDAVVAMERNQQADCVKEANLTKLRVLKNRYAGITGLATNLAYSNKTGRLREIKDVEAYLAPNIEDIGI